jgi:SagB-type dehydrogenase family enzyme
VSTGPAFDEPTYFRAAMSAGNLHPVELYVVHAGVDGAAAGVHHFAPLEHALVTVREGDWRGTLGDAAADDDVARVPASVVLTGVHWRTAWKYGERGYRHLWWDAGALVANLLAAAAGAGIAARVRVAFADGEVARLLDVDPAWEVPLAVVALGTPDEHRSAPPRPVPERMALATQPWSRAPIAFPLVRETHRAALLERAEVTAWRDRVATFATPRSTGTDPPAAPAAATIDDVIVQRGSTRLMRREAAPGDLLLWALDAATRAVPGDLDGTLLVHLLSVHAVDGVTPGLYRLAREEITPVRAGDARELAAKLCLDQPLGGDSAYTAFHAAELEALLAALGSRGYAAAQFEAGVVSGRLALAAFALGGGATGLTFYDDLVSRAFDTTASPMLATAVGVPAYRNRRGGRPGRAVELPGYARLMQRLSAQLRRR